MYISLFLNKDYAVPMIIHTCDIDVGFIIQIHDIQTGGKPLITTKDPN